MYVTSFMPESGLFSKSNHYPKFHTLKQHVVQRSKFRSKEIANFRQFFLLFLAFYEDKKMDNESF